MRRIFGGQDSGYGQCHSGRMIFQNCPASTSFLQPRGVRVQFDASPSGFWVNCLDELRCHPRSVDATECGHGSNGSDGGTRIFFAESWGDRRFLLFSHTNFRLSPSRPNIDKTLLMKSVEIRFIRSIRVRFSRIVKSPSRNKRSSLGLLARTQQLFINRRRFRTARRRNLRNPAPAQ